MEEKCREPQEGCRQHLDLRGSDSGAASVQKGCQVGLQRCRIRVAFSWSGSQTPGEDILQCLWNWSGRASEHLLQDLAHEEQVGPLVHALVSSIRLFGS